jgi:ubiquinone/menaquinone biosynthesis C-methylase UbiE
MTIVDVGCGTGFLAIELAKRCGPSSRVIAVDPWRAAMNRLQRKLVSYGINNVETQLRDAASIELPDASVDLIVSNLGINNFANVDAVLNECRRISKPGARLILTTNLVGHMAEFYEAFRSTLVEVGLAGQLESLESHINHRATVDSVKRQLVRAGFTLVDADESKFQERFANGTALLRHYRIRAGFLGGWKSVVPADRLIDTFQNLESRLNEIASTSGELSLTIPVACIQARLTHLV